MRNTALIFDVPIIKLSDYAKIKNVEKEDLKCGWSLDGFHDQVVAAAKLFGGEVHVPICDHHLSWHRGIVTLVLRGGMDVYDVLGLSRDLVMREVALKGLIPTWQ